MNDRDTLDVQLNVFGEFDPVLPESYRHAKYVFLANGVPGRADEGPRPRCRAAGLAVADTMDLWINNTREDLDKLLDNSTAWCSTTAKRNCWPTPKTLSPPGTA